MAQDSAAVMLANVPQTTAQPRGGDFSSQVIVYGPDGRTYANPNAAIRAGVRNYTMTPPQPVNPMLENIRRQQEIRRNYTADEKRMFRQASSANEQAVNMLRAELQAAGLDKNAVNAAVKAERQALGNALAQYKTTAQGTEGTQRFAGFGEGNYYAPTYTYAGPEAEAVRQRMVQGQQFLQQYGVPQFYRQGRTAIGINAPQAYALSQAMADGQISEEELTGQYGQYFGPSQARRTVRNINAIQPFVGNQNITAESFDRRLRPVKGMEGVYQTNLAGGQYNNVVGIFRDVGEGRYEYLGAAPTKTKKEDGGFFGNVLRIGGALIAPFNPPLGALASGIGTLASGGNLGQAILSGATTYGGASIGGIPGIGGIPAGVSSAIGGGIAAATPVTPQQPPIPSVAPAIV